MFKRRKISKLRRKEEIAFYLFILPWLIGLVVFSGGPIFATMFMGLTKWSLLGSPRWIGLGNYVKLFFDPLFYKALGNTFYYSGGRVALAVGVSLLAAVLLNQQIRGKTFFRTIYYLPSVTAGVALIMVFIQLYKPRYGPFSYFLSWLGIPAPSWLTNEQWAMPALIFMSLWTIGPNMLIFLAGLQGIPRSFYDAAQVDGANIFQQFFHVTLPALSPLILLVSVTTTIFSFQVFAEPYIMTDGGPNYATLTGAFYAYRNAFEYYKVGYACAFAWILLLVILGLTGIQFFFSRYWAYYGARR